MNNSIMGKLSLYYENEAKQTIDYLTKIGLVRDEYQKENIDYSKIKDIYIIEFKEKPFIFKTLEYNNMFDEENYPDITCIGEHGVSFCIMGAEFGVGIIFVPTSNINCIHIIEKDQIDREMFFKTQNL